MNELTLLQATIADVGYEIDLADVPEESRERILYGLARKGFQETVTDSASSVKDKAKKVEAREACVAAMLAGTYQFGTGGGRHSRSVEDVARYNVVRAFHIQSGIKAADFDAEHKGTKTEPWAIFDENDMLEAAMLVFEPVLVEKIGGVEFEANRETLEQKIVETRITPLFEKEVEAEKNRRAKVSAPKIADISDLL